MPTTEGRNALKGTETHVKRVVFPTKQRLQGQYGQQTTKEKDF